MNERTKGFSLVTVLFLIVGISITLGGVAFNFVTEGKLLKKNIDQNNSFYSAEIGLENAKTWIKNNTDKNTIPTSTTKIDSSQGAPQYCLKGYGIEELDVVTTEKKDISRIINTNNFTNYSYEYFIENITNQYSYNDSSSLIYYTMYNQDVVIVLDKFTGKNAGPSFPTMDIMSDGEKYEVTGWKGEFYPDYIINNIAVEGDKIFILVMGYGVRKESPAPYMLVLDRVTFKNIDDASVPKVTISGKEYSGYLLPSAHDATQGVGKMLYIDGEYLYYLAGKVQDNRFDHLIGVVKKLTGELAPSPFLTKTWRKSFYPYEQVDISYIRLPFERWMYNDAQISMNGNYIYIKKKRLNWVGTIDKIIGTENLSSNCPQNFTNDCTPGFYIKSPSDQLRHTIDEGKFIYEAWDVNGKYILTGIGNKSYRIKYINKFYYTEYANVRGLHLDGASTVGINSFIDGDYIFANNDKKNILIYNKNSGLKAGDPFSSITVSGKELSGYFVPGFHTYHSEVFLYGDTSSSNSNSSNEYYKINVCGYDKKLNLVRLESIVTYDNVNKKVNQISWKELF